MRTEIFNSLPEDARQIRIAVFMDEQGFAEEFDALDEICTHLVMYDGALPVACARIWQADDSWHVGRLAVIKSHRNLRLGQAMLQAAEEYVCAQSGTCISLHAQCRAESFYRKCGYLPYGEIDYDEGVPHVHMRKNLNFDQS